MAAPLRTWATSAPNLSHGGAGSPNGAMLTWSRFVSSCQGLQAASRHSGRTVSGWIQRGAGCLGWLHAAVCHSLDPFALGISSYGDYVSQGALHGLKVVAVAVVAQAVWGMARNLCTDGLRVTIMAIATCVVLLVPSAWGQVGVIAIAGIAGRLLFKPAKVVEHDPYLSRSVTGPACFGSRCSLSC